MGRKKKGFTIKISSKDIKVRSPFANMPISGCGPHKSVKDYNRQASKLDSSLKDKAIIRSILKYIETVEKFTEKEFLEK